MELTIISLYLKCEHKDTDYPSGHLICLGYAYCVSLIFGFFFYCRETRSPDNYSMTNSVKSYCRPYWDTQDLRPYISDYY